MKVRGKGKVTRRCRPPAATAIQQAIQLRGFAPLQIALSKARAARILLSADADYLQIPVSLKPGDTEASVREWIQDFAFNALDAALEEAEAEYEKLPEYLKLPDPPIFGPTRKAVA